MSTYFLSIFIGTFALEDAALIAAITLASQNKISYEAAFVASFLGIAIGDIGIYIMGFLSTKLKFISQLGFFKKNQQKLARFRKKHSIGYLVVVSRFLPGTRVITYLLAGISGYSFLRFNVLTLISVFVWVLAAFMGGLKLMNYFSNNIFLGMAILILIFYLLNQVLPKFFDKWEREILFNSWRKWTSFEFWPAWFFYIPLYFYYFFQSIRYRSFFVPFYINPTVHNGGILGESKWDFLQHLNAADSSTLKTIKFAKDQRLIDLKKELEKNEFKYPIILKPDVGQRGFGVRIIRNEIDLESYFKDSSFDLIVQDYCSFRNEAGIFYIRYPNESKGFIYSITDKKFPTVTGDGKSALGDIIAADSRARILLPAYYGRHQEKLDTVLPKGEQLFLSECGNHCQGALFFNGQELITPELTEAIDIISKKTPHFYFGRYDLRYESVEKLKKGEGFKIVEINGASAEATHIWDPSTPVLTAYKSLLHQWGILFAISYELKKQRELVHQVHIWSFLKESAKVYFRKEKMSISS
ncbi:MAG: VTT domain-containing protein [Pseudobdellovibrio sp.]